MKFQSVTIPLIISIFFISSLKQVDWLHKAEGCPKEQCLLLGNRVWHVSTSKICESHWQAVTTLFWLQTYTIRDPFSWCHTIFWLLPILTGQLQFSSDKFQESCNYANKASYPPHRLPAEVHAEIRKSGKKRKIILNWHVTWTLIPVFQKLIR